MPQVTDIEDNVGVFTGSLTSGSVTDDTTPTISGTGTPGSTILIFDGNNPIAIATATVAANGSWSVDVPLTPNVTHTLTFGAVDDAGNSLTADNPLTLIVDTLPPATPTVTSVDPKGTLVSGSADRAVPSSFAAVPRSSAKGSQTVQVTSLSQFRQHKQPVRRSTPSLRIPPEIKATRQRLALLPPAFLIHQRLRSLMTLRLSWG